ncbi:unnamed protein product [Mucor hiemalis]
MELEGSCHCEKVKFKVTSHAPVPYVYCYCSICLKCQGGGGYSIDIEGDYNTLKFSSGKDCIKEYRAYIDKQKKIFGESYRYFCGECGSYLYLYNPRKKDKVYPFASAIDTPLPKVDQSEIDHILYDCKRSWVPEALNNHKYKEGSEYPEFSQEEWHKKHGKYIARMCRMAHIYELNF